MSLVDKAIEPASQSVETGINAMEKLLEFLYELHNRKIFYKLSNDNYEAIMVEIAVPGERWEVEFFADGSVEVEIFDHSSGVKGGEEAEKALARLFKEFSD